MKSSLPFEWKITIIYIIIGALWILFSDKMLLYVTNDPQQISIISIYKGWFYVLITGILLFYLIRREIKKQNRLVEDLITANKKALESERLKSAFLSNLSHYIRTPMNSILGFAELIQSRNVDESKRERFLNLINEKSHHLLQTINNIVEISKIQEGQVETKQKLFSINNLFDKLILIYEPELAKKGSQAVLIKNIALNATEDEVLGDFDKLYHILSNLLSNAVNFTKQGTIELGVTFNNDNNIYTFYVKDTGTGISAEKQKKLFVNFMQAHSDIQSASEGSGLGLFLSSKLANLLGGNLWLEHSDEHGSLFCFSLQNLK